MLENSEPSAVEETIVRRPGVQIKPKQFIQKKQKQNKPRLKVNKLQNSRSGILQAVVKNHLTVTAKHVEKKLQINPVKTAMISEESKSAILNRKRKLKRVQSNSINTLNRRLDVNKHLKQFTTDNLVELYHNAAIKESDSDDSNNAANKEKKHQKLSREVAIPPLAISSKILACCGNTGEYKEMEYTEPAAPRALSNVYSIISRNYELPTIASKLKEVAKSYLHAFNLRSIPFCAATSITPSHNIGINIQQVMSIIKTRQPIAGISPTLAHNIGLAAEKLNSKPLHALVSTLSSRMG